jgi:hypothetical protein
MTTTVERHQLEERLGRCPECGFEVVADAYAIRSRGVWYHLRCAIERDKCEGAASVRVA